MKMIKTTLLTTLASGLMLVASGAPAQTTYDRFAPISGDTVRAAGFHARARATQLAAAAPAGKTQHLTSADQVPKGLAKSDWASIRAAYEAGRHAFQPVAGQDGVWQARNPGQQWLTKFDGRGLLAEPKDGGWQWGLELKRYGFPGAERDINGASAVKAEGQRLVFSSHKPGDESLLESAQVPWVHSHPSAIVPAPINTNS